MYVRQPGTEVLLACPLVFTKDIKVKGEAVKQVTWRTHAGGAWYEALMTPEVHKAALDQEWDEKWRQPAPKPTKGMGNFVNVVESVMGTDGHENKAPGQIFKKAIDAQETITAPLKRRMGIHTANLSKKQKGKLQAKLDENAILFENPSSTASSTCTTS